MAPPKPLCLHIKLAHLMVLAIVVVVFVVFLRLPYFMKIYSKPRWKNKPFTLMLKFHPTCLAAEPQCKTSCGAALVRINYTAELCGDSFRAVIYYKSRV